MTNNMSAILSVAFSAIALGVGSLILAGGGFFTSVASPDGEGLHLKGKLDLVLYDEFGNVKEERHLDNLVVNSGMHGVAYRISTHNGTASATPYNYIAIGTDGTAVSATQNVLGAENARLLDALVIYNNSTKKLTLDATFLAGTGTGNIQESGIFNAASAGQMLARQQFASINKGVNDSLTITWTITLS